jgi:hypothetical protein
MICMTSREIQTDRIPYNMITIHDILENPTLNTRYGFELELDTGI